ncbi:hypothetical protein AK812_SmicGene47554, partial [Symbiodinium microadriaticum]
MQASENSKGVDAGGLTRDFFSSFSSTLVDDPQMK